MSFSLKCAPGCLTGNGNKQYNVVPFTLVAALSVDTVKARDGYSEKFCLGSLRFLFIHSVGHLTRNFFRHLLQ